MNNIISKIILVETRSYQDAVIRPYNLRMDNDSLNKLEGMLNRGGDAIDRITDVTLAHNLPGVIGLSASPQLAHIPYGWQTKRLRFMMEVISDRPGGRLFTYIQGFSNYYDVSLSNHIDPEMILYVNSVTEVQELILPTGEPTYRVLKSYNTFSSGAIVDDQNSLMHSGFKVVRPMDVVASLNSLPDLHDESGSIVFDTVSRLNTGDTSWRRNNNPGKYFATTLNSYIDSQNSSLSASYNYQDMKNNTLSMVAENTLLSNPFFHHVSNITGEVKPSQFTVGFLNHMDPGLLSDRNRTILIKRDNEPVNLSRDYSVLDSDTTENLFQPNIETLRAQEVANSLLDLTVSNFITELVVSFSNNSTTGEPIITIQDVQCFISNISEIDFCNQLISYIKMVILPKISNNNELLVEVSARLSLIGDTSIFISFNGQPGVLFRFPSFADSCYAPVISTTGEKNGLVDEFRNVLAVVGADRMLTDYTENTFRYY